MSLRNELERLDRRVQAGDSYGYRQDIWRQMLDALDAVDALGVAIADAGYTWTPEMRAAYDSATGEKLRDYQPRTEHKDEP